MFGINKKQSTKGIGEKFKKRTAKKKQEDKQKLTIIPDLICKSFVDGCLVLACIHDIKNTELVVSLPGIGNFGYVKLNNISSIYTNLLKNFKNDTNELSTLLQMYKKGEIVRCKVLNYKDKKLYLTIEPDQINQGLTFKNLDENMILTGSVKTKEDHGYTIDLGFDDLTAFYKTNDFNISLGQSALFKIVKKPTSRSINVALCNQYKESVFYDLNNKYQFDSYLPGAHLNGCTVDKVGKSGLQVNISNQLIGYIHSNHVPQAKRAYLVVSETDSKKKPAFSNGDKINATIIFINPYARVVYLSLLPHLIDSTKNAKIMDLFTHNRSEDSLKLGQILDDVQVNMHTHKGIFVKFNGPNSKQCTGFIPKRHLYENNNSSNKDDDENESEEETEKDSDGNKLKKSKRDAKNMKREDIEKSFPLNSKLRARIYDFNMIEDLILLSSRKSILNTTFMNYEELKVGQIVNCTIKKVNLENGGVNVNLSEFVTGFIPKMHTSDVPLSENLIQRKYKVGKEVKCKIVQLNPDEKRCVLTAKKTLIKSKLPLISSFDDLKHGMETYGVVVSIQSYGILLGFLNDIKGLLPRQFISTSTLLKNPNQDLKELYYIGQLIKCKVFNFDKNKQQIKLSLIMDNKIEESKNLDENKKIDLEYEVGDLIDTSTILQVNEEKSYFRLKLPRNGSKNGILYKSQLSDFDSLNDALFEYYKLEKKIDNSMVVKLAQTSSSKPSSCHYLTLKKSIIDFYTNLKNQQDKLDKSFDDLKKNTWLHAWIKKILDNGILVELPNDLTGFSSNKELKYLDELKSSNLNGLTLGQSILVKINKLFNDKQRFTTNLKTRFDLMQKNSIDSEYMIELFKSYLFDMKKIMSLNLSNDQTPNGPFNLWYKYVSKIKLGSIVKVVVKAFNSSSGRLECLFLNDLAEKNNFTSNQIGYAFVDSEENDIKKYTVGSKLDAMVIGFDPIARAFCLTINKKDIKMYSKNFDPKFQRQVNCRVNQSIKASIIYVSQWFCIVGLKAHGLGRLAFMPLFRNDFTQLNTFNTIKNSSINNYEMIDSKIKQKQVLDVSVASLASLSFNAISEDQNEKLKENAASVKSAKLKSKQDKRFSYFYVGQLIKVIVKEDNLDLDHLIVVHDSSNVKRNRKKLLRQLAILNEDHVNGESSLKRKHDGGIDGDEPVIIKKKLVIKEDVKSSKKRKLSEINKENDEPNSKKEDFIEIVANVKQTETKKSTFGLDLIPNGLNMADLFKMDVQDFDQFDAIVNETANGVDEKKSKSTDGSHKKEKKAKITTKNKKPDEEEEELESVESYETLVSSNPNSSSLWIKYMNFYLKMAETEKARAVAERALKTIFYRDDNEKLNMWVALLNFECIHGSQASLDDTFNRASQNCDSYKIHSHMAEIYIKAHKLEEAEAVYVKMTRKFSKMPDVWIRYGIFHYRNSNCELARKLLIKSFNSLDKADHVEMVNKFAQLEFKYGDVERAKTMYDTLLFTYQNRTDIWSVYIDMLIKYERYDDARQIFNRIIQMGLTVKRMKFIFKKYIDFETAHGSEETVEHVKELAIKYAEKNEFNDEKQQQKNDKNDSIEKNLKKNLNI